MAAFPRGGTIGRAAFGAAGDAQMKEMIFWGATGQAKVLRECMASSGLRLAALFDNNPGLQTPFPDVPLYIGREGFKQWLTGRRSNDPVGFLVAIGGDRGRDRVAILEFLQGQGLVPLVARHATAFVAANASIGPGSQVLANSAVCVEAALGRACIVNTGATVDHECRLGDGIHVGPGAHLAGCVDVGPFAMIGAGAVILPHVRVGEKAIVGAGAVVVRDVPPETVVVGNPARVLRTPSEIDGLRQ